jgi:hypothetical protein
LELFRLHLAFKYKEDLYKNNVEKEYQEGCKKRRNFMMISNLMEVDKTITQKSQARQGYIGWQAGTTALCQSQLYPPFRDYEFGFWSSGNCM